MAEMTVADWTTFLRARIEQERGQDAQALSVFERLLEKYPNDPHLNSSRAFALQRLGREQEAIASSIAARYTSLGQALVGPNDTPDVWISALQDVVEELERPERAAEAAARPLMVW
jgi:predicted Zn-dependent protease